jgi:large subunit ribosomal protein L10
MANQKILEQKQNVVNEIADCVKESSSVVFFEYRGLSVGEMTELRRTLRENDSDLKVYKNTLTRRALNTLDINLDEELTGPKALAYGKDAIAPIKVISEFAKKHPALEIKVGIVDGEIARIETLNELATIPSREGLLTMLAGGLIGVVRDLSISLDLYSQELEK